MLTVSWEQKEAPGLWMNLLDKINCNMKKILQVNFLCSKRKQPKAQNEIKCVDTVHNHW